MTIIYLFYIIKYMIFTDNKIMRLFVLLIIIYYFISQTTWDQPQIKIKHVLFILHIQK